ncbi:Ribosomal large subunit pseudouridine synthase B [Candidatus Magnetaquicoccaceae bacterium FCR-1]|uniref:Pseudouridine synthase n=1 Tax=Candidatus Magnetaquiglobus chichijimensis TaxID=3141448 RepID=A0ABQ0C7D4_9PROT
MSGVRLQKWLAEAGLCSRREGERWIEAGRVSVDGQIVTTQGVQVGPDVVVCVDGQPVAGRKGNLKVVVALHKPVGVICSRRDPDGRPSVFGLVEGAGVRLVSVGRLDYNSEGLLLFTNDGELANRLTHPRHEVPRVYRVRVHGRVDEPLLNKLRAGVTLEDGPTGPLDIALERVVGANSWLTLTLKEGRNRIIRRIFAAFEMDVARLIRVSYAGIELGEIPSGAWRYLTRAEVGGLLRLVGPRG